MERSYKKNGQYTKFCLYGFLKNLRFFDAFLLLYFLDAGISFTQIGVMYAMRVIITNISEIPSGIAADTYGRKKSLVFSFIVYIISFLIFYFSHDFTLLLMAMVLYGIGDAFRSGTHKGMIMDYLKINQWESDKVDYYGHTRSWSQKGSAISALLAGFLVLYSGSYRIIFLFSSLPYFINLVNIWTYPKEIDYSLDKNGEHHIPSINSVVKNFLSVIKKPSVFKIINSSALHTSFLETIKDYIQPLMLQVAILIPIMQSIDIKKKSGLIIGIIYFFIFLLTSYASKNAAKVSALGFKNLINLTLVLGLTAGVICGVLMNYEIWNLSLFVFIVIYVVENLRKPILTGALADNVPYDILTSVLSAQSFYKTLITSAMALLLGILADAFGIGMSIIAISSLLVIFNFSLNKLLSQNL